MDMDMSAWPRYKLRYLIKDYGFLYGCYMYHRWNKCYNNISKITSWAIRWHFSVLVNKGICLSSTINLSKNIGIGSEDSTHYTKKDTDPYTHVPFGNIEWPVQIPDKIELTKEKLVAERREFIRIRKLGLKKIIRKQFRKITWKR
jgi:hypothetical protein